MQPGVEGFCKAALRRAGVRCVAGGRCPPPPPGHHYGNARLRSEAFGAHRKLWDSTEMPIRSMRMLAVLVSALTYWEIVSHVTGAAEPWDASAYWRLWYPASRALSALAGFWLRRHADMAGAILTFAQLPILQPNTGFTGLWPLSVAMLTLLALPAIALSALAGRIATHHLGA